MQNKQKTRGKKRAKCQMYLLTSSFNTYVVDFFQSVFVLTRATVIKPTCLAAFLKRESCNNVIISTFCRVLYYEKKMYVNTRDERRKKERRVNYCISPITLSQKTPRGGNVVPCFLMELNSSLICVCNVIPYTLLELICTRTLYVDGEFF